MHRLVPLGRVDEVGPAVVVLEQRHVAALAAVRADAAEVAVGARGPVGHGDAGARLLVAGVVDVQPHHVLLRPGVVDDLRPLDDAARVRGRARDRPSPRAARRPRSSSARGPATSSRRCRRRRCEPSRPSRRARSARPCSRRTSSTCPCRRGRRRRGPGSACRRCRARRRRARTRRAAAAGGAGAAPERAGGQEQKERDQGETHAPPPRRGRPAAEFYGGRGALVRAGGPGRARPTRRRSGRSPRPPWPWSTASRRGRRCGSRR